MKTTLKHLLIPTLLLISMSSFVYGQDQTDPSLRRIIYLLEGTEKKEIVLPVAKETKFFSLPIKAGVKEGEITIEIVDPSGEQRQKYAVGSPSNPDKKFNSMMVYQPFRNPLKGNWLIKINSKNAKGYFIVDTYRVQYTEIQPLKTITGTVTVENNKPLYGAIVLIKGTTRGTTTDKSGNFSLTVPQNTESLIFTFLGMKTQEVKIGEQTKFNVALIPE